MTQRQRLQQLVALVRERKLLSVEEAMTLLGASAATIRRDFLLLSEERQVQKVRGGISPLQGECPPEQRMPSLQSRSILQLKEKQKIAEEALRQLPEGCIVMLGGGSTTLQMAPLLAQRRLRIITNSIVLAQQIDGLRGESGGSDVMVTGGTLFPRSGLLVGPRCIEDLENFRADYAILSVAGIDEHGVSNNNELASEVERMMIRQSQHFWVLADHSKIGQRDLCHVCELRRVDKLITNTSELSVAKCDLLRQAGLNIDLA